MLCTVDVTSAHSFSICNMLCSLQSVNPYLTCIHKLVEAVEDSMSMHIGPSAGLVSVVTMDMVTVLF